MRYLLRAMGFWIWGLIAIAISVSVLSVAYKMVSVYRATAISADSSANTNYKALDSRTAFPAASREPVFSHIIAADMLAAQKANRDGRWTEALEHLQAAENNAPLTADDRKFIEDSRAYSYIKLGNFRAAQAAYESALTTGAYRAEELLRIFRTLFQLAATNQQRPKAIEYGNKAYAAGVLKPDDLLIMSQLHYQENDCKSSAVWGDRAIASFKEEGLKPHVVLYQLKLQCASNASDASGMIAALSDLVRLTNETKYWNNLIRLERQEERDDRNTLMIYRLMFDTRSMQADTDYIEMAQLLGDAALPGEARTILETLTGSGLLKEEHRERTERLLNALSVRADADQKALPALEVEATKNRSGALDVKLGEVYFGAGDYRSAARAITRGIDRRQIEQSAEAYLVLGRSLMAQNNPTEAKKSFALLNTVPNINTRVLVLWNLYADMIETPMPSP